MSNYREVIGHQSRINISKTISLRLSKNQGFNINSKEIYEEENAELQLEERKRRMRDTKLDQMDIVMGQHITRLQTYQNIQGTVIFDGDLAASSKNVLAELVRQAIHSQ